MRRLRHMFVRIRIIISCRIISRMIMCRRIVRIGRIRVICMLYCS